MNMTDTGYTHPDADHIDCDCFDCERRQCFCSKCVALRTSWKPKVRSKIGDFPIYLNLEGAARMLDVSRPTMAKILERGSIEGRKEGTRWIIPAQQLLTYIGIESEVVLSD